VRGALFFSVAFVLVSAFPGQAGADDAAAESKQLTRLSLEELAALKVDSVSRRAEGNLEAAGAVHVVTEEDIRRTASTTIPDALRTAPGAQASRIDADEWAVAIRGFASRLSRSVLAVVDGRSVWTPLFAGVFWDAQDMVIEDVEQIEVSRGPGGASYGANALNGVISVTTRSARDTHGGLVSLGLGTADQSGGLRFGGVAGEDLHYRVFGKYANRDGTQSIPPGGYDDEWTMGTGGFRIDWDAADRNTFTVLGNIYDGNSLQPITIATFTPPYSAALSGDASFRGHSLVTRWRHVLSRGGELHAQAYYDHTTRREPYYGEKRDTFDLDVRHQFSWGSRHQVVWGANYRRSDGAFEGSPSIQLIPPERADDLAGFFVNDEIRAFRDRLRVTAGAKFEWNDYSGWNAQPSGRAAWVSGGHTFWGSATRALRTSSRVERGIVIYTSLSSTQPLFARTSGTEDFAPESVVALEAGYKLRLSRVLLTASAFRNVYYDLATNVVGAPEIEAGTGGEPPRLIIPVNITNGPKGRASGFEGKVIVSALASWRLQGAYSLLSLSLDGKPGETFKATSPRHQFWLTSFFTPVPKLDVDLLFRAVGSIPGHQIPSFVNLDARVAYRPSPRLEFSVSGANLIGDSRAEFGGGFAVERAVRAQATLHF
jgi:iron complex outermembrane receptor protein